MSNTTIYKWRVYCNNEASYQYQWSDYGITQCPNNNSHTLNGTCTATDSAKAVTITNVQNPYYYNNKSILADTSSGNIQIKLLKARKQKDKIIIIKKIASGNTLSIIPFSGDNIAGSTNNYNITSLNTVLILKSDGTTNWNSIGDIYFKPDNIGNFSNSNSKGDMLIDNGYEMSRLDLGNDNDVLTVDNTTSLGVTWKSFNSFIPSILFSTSFDRTTTQAFNNIAATSDSTICLVPIASNPPVPTQLTVVACMNSAGATGTIILKENSTLKTLATIIVNSGVITPTRYTQSVINTNQNLFILTGKTSTSSGSRTLNVYSMILS